jgi:hypothetical protein
MKRATLGCLLVASLSLGCGTFMTIDETDPMKESPPGIVVNSSTYYLARATLIPGSPLNPGGGSVLLETKGKLRLVDQERLLAINILRMPFASGKLTFALDANQTLKQVGISSATGLPRAGEAAKSALESAAAIEAAKAKAEEAGTQ